MTKIFISHKSDDELSAKRIATRIQSNGIELYLDVIDPYLSSDERKLTEYIRDQLGSSTHMLTVLSSNTSGSWWVPFEIGIATEKEKPIANYFINDIIVPGYLKMWPYLKNNDDIDKFIKWVKADRSLIIEKNASLDKKISKANLFHKNLKKDLGQ